MKRTTIYLGKDMHRELKVMAAETDTMMADLVRDAVQDFLCKHQGRS